MKLKELAEKGIIKLPDDIDFCLRVKAWCKKNGVKYVGDYLIAPVFHNMMEEISNLEIDEAKLYDGYVKKEDIRLSVNELMKVLSNMPDIQEVKVVFNRDTLRKQSIYIANNIKQLIL